MEPPDLPVVPGDEAAASVRLRNSGAVVDQFEMDVLGDAAGWARVEPAIVNLLPGEEGVARLVFAPPKSARVAAGPVPFALRVMSREDTAGSRIEESVITVGTFRDTAAELVPRTSTGRMTGRHKLALDNLGNSPQMLSVQASDPDRFLDFTVEPANVTVDPGTAVFVGIKAKPRKRFLQGPEKSLPFEVRITSADAEPTVLPGAMVQQSLLPNWFFKALALLLALAIALVALWYLLLKPTVESTAQNVAEDHTKELAGAIVDASDQAAQAQQQVAQAQQEAAQAQQQAAEAKQESSQAQQSASTSKKQVETVLSGGGVAGGTLNKKSAIDFRVDASVRPAGGFEKTEHVPKEKTTLWVSDLVLQNPHGDRGTLRIQRGDKILLVFGMQNYRDLDYHFIQPTMFSHDQPVVVSVDCQNPQNKPCEPSVFFTGQRVEQKPAPKKQQQNQNQQ